MSSRVPRDLLFLLILTLSEGAPRSALPDFREGERGDRRDCPHDLSVARIHSNLLDLGGWRILVPVFDRKL